jgi:hypothetical protein
MIQDAPTTFLSLAPLMWRGPLTRRYAPTSPRKRGEVRNKQRQPLPFCVSTPGKCKKLQHAKRSLRLVSFFPGRPAQAGRGAAAPLNIFPG